MFAKNPHPNSAGRYSHSPSRFFAGFQISTFQVTRLICRKYSINFPQPVTVKFWVLFRSICSVGRLSGTTTPLSLSYYTLLTVLDVLGCGIRSGTYLMPFFGGGCRTYCNARKPEETLPQTFLEMLIVTEVPLLCTVGNPRISNEVDRWKSLFFRNYYLLLLVPSTRVNHDKSLTRESLVPIYPSWRCLCQFCNFVWSNMLPHMVQCPCVSYFFEQQCLLLVVCYTISWQWNT